jgi:hypothetical protein
MLQPPSDASAPLPHHEQAEAVVAAPREQLFHFIDDPRHLAAHMSGRTWRTGGTTMHLTLDAGGGRRPGSRMRLEGRVLGIRLAVDTEVIEREPPVRKTWQTVGEPQLLVIGSYRMSVAIHRVPAQSSVVVRIDYALPANRRDALSRWLARAYARWCVRRMVSDVAHAFEAGLPRELAAGETPHEPSRKP